jgi:hypothetical protein
MGSHGRVRGSIRRLAALTLMALVATGAGLVPCGPPLAPESEASSAQGAGMKSTPIPEASVSATLPVSPAGESASVAPRARASLARSLAPGIHAATGSRPTTVGTCAPTILRI